MDSDRSWAATLCLNRLPASAQPMREVRYCSDNHDACDIAPGACLSLVCLALLAFDLVPTKNENLFLEGKQLHNGAFLSRAKSSMRNPASSCFTANPITSLQFDFGVLHDSTDKETDLIKANPTRTRARAQRKSYSSERSIKALPVKTHSSKKVSVMENISAFGKFIRERK